MSQTLSAEEETNCTISNVFETIRTNKKNKKRLTLKRKKHTHIKKKKRKKMVSKITFFSRKKSHERKKHTVPMRKKRREGISLNVMCCRGGKRNGSEDTRHR